MFKGLRLRLTATYIAAALGLVLLMGLGTYGLLRFYFQSDNDGALRYRVALEYDSLGIGLPPELQAAKESWESRQSELADTSALPPGLAKKAQGGQTSATGEEGELTDGGEGPPWKAYPDAELAPLFVLHLDSSGNLVADASSTEGDPPTPVAESQKAATATPDVRTATLTDGSEVRVATYRLPASAVSESQPIAYIQAGRLLADQNRVLSQILLTVLLACGGAAVVVGLVSWYLAGRSLGPAAKAWEQQQIFVANASHELRAPVTLIRASTEYALRQYAATGAVAETPGRETSPDPSMAEVLTDVVTETDHLSRLVDDLLLLSRIDAGKLELETGPLPVAELFSDIGHAFGRLAEEKGVTLQADSDGTVVRADRTRLRQIILILLDNALRYTPPEGAIRLDARAEGRRVIISVADTGAGIAAEDLPHVLDRFYQGGARPDEDRGSGLGLSIAKTLVEAQKGRIDVASRTGEGTRVTLSLPRADSPRRARGSSAGPADQEAAT
jgi:signal transduction histidine kinase